MRKRPMKPVAPVTKYAMVVLPLAPANFL
jgi:hypothetical protein